MLDRGNLVYIYDGSFEGFLSCVFATYEFKEMPYRIVTSEGMVNLFDVPKTIPTDPEKAERVYRSIPVKIDPRAQDLVRLGFLTCAPDKELLILKFLRLGYKVGARVMDMLADETVDALIKAVRSLKNEAAKYQGFVRFSVYNEALVAVIEPKNFVLPLLAPHFCDRYRNEDFLIYDRTHGAALVYQNRALDLIKVENLELPPVDPEEAEYRRLWQRFYQAIAIESRYNPRCRMTLMPKRYWSQLTEMAPEQGAGL